MDVEVGRHVSNFRGAQISNGDARDPMEAEASSRVECEVVTDEVRIPRTHDHAMRFDSAKTQLPIAIVEVELHDAARKRRPRVFQLPIYFGDVRVLDRLR